MSVLAHVFERTSLTRRKKTSTGDTTASSTHPRHQQPTNNPAHTMISSRWCQSVVSPSSSRLSFSVAPSFATFGSLVYSCHDHAARNAGSFQPLHLFLVPLGSTYVAGLQNCHFLLSDCRPYAANVQIRHFLLSNRRPPRTAQQHYLASSATIPGVLYWL